MPELISTVIFTNEEPSSPECLRLIEQLSTELGDLYKDDGGASSYDPHEQLTPGSAFLVARIAGRPVGCGAVRPLAPGIGEVKRMYVVSAARGQGISRIILRELERVAVELGYGRLKLETGILQPHAISLYQSAGYLPTACYGYYVDDPRSRCFEKVLNPEPQEL